MRMNYRIWNRPRLLLFVLPHPSRELVDPPSSLLLLRCNPTVMLVISLLSPPLPLGHHVKRFNEVPIAS